MNLSKILPTDLQIHSSVPKLGGRTAAEEEAAEDRPAKRVKLEHCTHEEVAKLTNPFLGMKINFLVHTLFGFGEIIK